MYQNNPMRLFSIMIRWHALIGFIFIFLTSGLHAEEVTQEFRGLTLNANLKLAKGKDFNDGMVLIIHGYLAHNNMEIIRSSQQVLLDNDMSSLAINLSLGIDNRHGFFHCASPHRHTQENGVKEIAAWIAWLREMGTRQVTILAHSRGANLSMVYAVEQKDPEVTHMVMLAPGTGERVRQIYQERYGKSLDTLVTLAEEKIASGKGGELMHDIDMLLCAKTSVSAVSFLSYYSRNNKFRQFRTYLPKISIPTLIIAGTEDSVQQNIVELLTPIIDGEHIQVSVIEGAGHFFRDINMDEAIEASVEFITQ